MKTKISILTMLTGLACLIFTTASLAQTDDYQKVQKSVFDPVLSQEKGGTPGLWTGAVSSNWHDPLNWGDGVVPGSTVDVVIPAPPSNQPVISTNLANCKSLTIHPWASLTIGAYYLTIQNDLTVYGALNKNSASGLIRVYGNVVWESGSTAGFTANSSFRVYGDWNFNEGANVNFANGAIDFMGYSDSWIRCYSNNCSFNNLRIYKSLAAAKVSNLSTHDLVINGLTFVDTHATLESFSNENILMGGDFIYYGNFDFTKSNNDGSVIFNGTSQTIDNYETGSGTFGHVVFSSSIGTFVADGDFNVARNLTIEQGYFNAGSATITVGGNWTNNAGAGGFIPTSSTIIFESGGDHQDVNGTNTFNNVTQLNAGKYLRFFGPTTIQNNLALNYLCWAYQNMNINGMLDLSNVGSRFTANTGNANVTIALLNQGGKLMANGGGSIFVNNLVQNHVGGVIEAGSGSLIDITNLGAEPWVDLKGSIYNSGGTINLSGSLCYWPFAHGAHLEMTDGIIDIKTCGLVIDDLYSWTHSITGGTIRTSGGFSGNRADFTPTAGTFEFYGSGDHFISQSNGCTLYDVVINKSAKGGGENFTSEPVYDERSGEQLSGGGKANTILLGSAFTITGHLIIESGTLHIGSNELTISKNVFISGTLSMTNASGVLNAGTLSSNWLEFNSGSFADVSHGIINCYGWIIPRTGSSFNLGLDNTLFIKGVHGGGLSNYESTATYGNVVIEKDSNKIVYLDGSSTHPIVVTGNFSISPSNTFVMQNRIMKVNGFFTDHSTSAVYLSHLCKNQNRIYHDKTFPMSDNLNFRGGLLEIDTDFILNGVLNVGDGEVLIHGAFESASTSSILISTGAFINDAPHTLSWLHLNGDLNMSGGLLELTNGYPYFSSTATTTISGGIIRIAGSLIASSGVFQPTGGIVEVIGNNPGNTIFCYEGSYFYDLYIYRDILTETNLATNTLIKNNLVVERGKLKVNSKTLQVEGNVEVNSGGELKVLDVGKLLMGTSATVTVSNGGFLQFWGFHPSHPTTISRQSSGYYDVNIESGATISAENAIFEYMNTAGINIKPGAIVNPEKSFTNCIFRNGQSGGRLLTLNNNQTLLMGNVSFQGSSGNFNVSKTVDEGVVVLTDYSGGFAGASWEQDDHNRIHWTGEPSTDIVLDGVAVGSYEDFCFEAIENITVGGSQNFVVEAFGVVNLVAGESILMLPGTHAHSGSYLHARISDVSFCSGLPLALVAAINEDPDQDNWQEINEVKTDEGFIKVFPNPARDIITLELASPAEDGLVVIEVYNLMGQNLMNKKMAAKPQYQLDLTGLQSGVYLLKLTHGNTPAFTKLIKQ